METPVQETVQKMYSQAAQVPNTDLCCSTGYNFSQLREFIPEEVLNVSYGCGTPAGLDDVQVGEVVLDIGSGGGIDCFEALKRVGERGRVIGVDMTDEMLQIARLNAPIVCKNLKHPSTNVEFRKGYAEVLPVEDGSIDLVISNCVINLAPNKTKVFQEMFRALKPGGRFTISDIVADQEVPNYLIHDSQKWGQCLSGALQVGRYLDEIRKAGFLGVHQLKCTSWKSIDGIHFFSITITGHKLGDEITCATPPADKSPGARNDSRRLEFATLKGPFSKAVSEFGTSYIRGVSVPISSLESKVISKTRLSQYFELSGEPRDILPTDARYVSLKPENKPCVWEGDFVILTSFFQQLEDDDNHIYRRGEFLEICSKTRKVLDTSLYQNFFSIIRRASNQASNQEVSCDTGGNCC